jgi:hypothetical protein
MANAPVKPESHAAPVGARSIQTASEDEALGTSRPGDGPHKASDDQPQPETRREDEAPALDTSLKARGGAKAIRRGSIEAAMDRRDIPYLRVAETFEKMVATKSRLAITHLLATLFQSVLVDTMDPEGHSDSETLLATIYLCTNNVAPAHKGMLKTCIGLLVAGVHTFEIVTATSLFFFFSFSSLLGIELGIGGSTVAAAVSQATGMSRARMRQLYKETGENAILDVDKHRGAERRVIVSAASPLPLLPLTCRGFGRCCACGANFCADTLRAQTAHRQRSVQVFAHDCGPQGELSPSLRHVQEKRLN